MASIPIGVIPLGTVNSLAKSLFEDGRTEVDRLAMAAMCVVKGRTKPVDVMHIKVRPMCYRVTKPHEADLVTGLKIMGVMKKLWDETDILHLELKIM